MINLYKPSVYSDDIKEVVKQLKNGSLSGNTSIVKSFEEKLGNYLNSKYCLVTSNGTTALHLALLGSGIKKDDEVIVPSLSYIASANAVSYIGAKPVFVDILKDTFQINEDLIEKSITKKTKAILPVHLYGGAPNLKKIKSIAKKYNLKVIHDAAEALGTKYDGVHSSTFKDIGTLSFFPNKLITTGEGGAIVTNNYKIYDLCLKLRSQGVAKNSNYKHDVIGYNYRMSSLSAAMGYSQIDKIDAHLAKKEKVFNQYINKLTEFNIDFQKNNKEVMSSYWLTVALMPKKININDLQNFLYSKNIETRRVFFPLPLQKPYKSNQSNRYRESLEIYKRGICIPSYPDLKKSDQEHIINSLIQYIRKNN